MVALVKKDLTKKQEVFLDMLFSNGGNVIEAMEVAKYHPSSRSNLLTSLRNEIAERTKSSLAGAAAKSAKRIEEALDADGTIPTSQMETRMKAAADILDRVGVGKRQEIDIKAEVIHGVVLLPPKKEETIVEHVG
tara:strand:- start:1507 stop:1911 length:405 start_codon:yes stop_codon:yes gene_type:complete